MKAEIISIGDELLIGQTINTNSAWLGEQLNMLGIRVHRAVNIADDRDEIVNALNEASSRSQVVIMTGGLGPTKDDITKKTLCEYFQTDLVLNEEALERITAFFAARGVPMLDVNRDQALQPRACRVIQNHRGTACGMWFERDGVIFVSMPGVPYEMYAMMSEEVLPAISSHFKRPEIYHRTILTIGVGESFLAKSIEAWENSLAEHHIKLAYLPSPGMVKLRMSSYGELTGEEAQRVFAEKEKELRALIGSSIYGEEKESIESVIGDLLKKRGETLSVAESCTGGMLSHLITSIPGASQYYLGTLIPYDASFKVRELGVDPQDIERDSVVSRSVAESMAKGVKAKFGTTWGISTTGIAGPDGGTEQTPVGTVWVGISGPERTYSTVFQLGKSRERTIRVASAYALNLLRKEILHLND